MLYGRNGINTGYNQKTPEPLDEPTQKLFKAIENENLEGFKQALKEGADVNAFDGEGMTPLMSIVNACATSGDGQPTLEKMAKLLIQNSSIDINAQSREYVYEERQKKDRHGRLVYLSLGREVVQMQSGYYVYCDDDQPVDGGNSIHLSEIYGGVMEYVKTSKMKKDTALHIACQVGARDMVKILLTYPNASTNVRNYKYESPENCIERGSGDVIKLEFKKAQKANELLGALASRKFYQANMLLNEELNPNCWKRTYNEEIETPLSLIIESCLRGITPGNEEVLTKLLKHKELDFSQIKPIQAIERNPWVKRIIEQAITERLTATINKKDLDDVKKLVEDNDFMSHAIVTAALRGVNNPIESITNYLNEKFPANTLQPLASTNIPAGFEEFAQELVDELEKTKAQLAEKEQELDSAKQEKLSQQARISALTNQVARLTEERDRFLSENRLLRTKSLSNKNEKPSRAISPGKKQSNCASASFVLSGAFAIGACLTIPNLEICIPLAVTAFAFFTIGCYCSYKANTALSDVKSTQVSVQRSGRIR
ncbi:TomO hydrophobic C-terminal domain-containing protein [Wolbachia endosymbiont of Oedothorax gibbosus]|uniref:TomO hydrophobic C-terminal domain-containing protein n=1 Tax=Wolbachia endosymbiont of Oedothorax gibbosus TaxID=931100 RepID=UPI0020243750|nr:ankyrin repeat domain-containing protein [Wolbachia endosymbiont of Oedothorax gibbosus]